MGAYNSPADLESVLRDIQSRLANLALATKVTHGSGPPPDGAAEPYVDDTNNRVYFKPNGIWRYVTLT